MFFWSVYFRLWTENTNFFLKKIILKKKFNKLEAILEGAL